MKRILKAGFIKNQLIRDYFSETIIVFLLLGFYLKGFYYGNLLIRESKIVLIILSTLYIFFILPINVFSKKNYNLLFKGSTVIVLTKRFFSLIFTKNINSLRNNFFTTDSEKQQFLFFLVKVIFIPIMLNFFLIYVITLIKFFSNLTDFRLILTEYTWFFLLTYIIFSIDTLFFSFGYIVESSKLNNLVKSVDSSILGWFAALACYKPFNNVTYRLFPLFTNENIYWINDKITTLLYLIVLVFYVIFVWSTIALGSKCSNLTNRGIIDRGPYRIVRHPAYSAKVLAWWIFCIPVFNLKVFVSMLIWSLIYIIRAYTEEKHLFADKDYQKYCEKVRYRFIPLVY